MAEIIINNWSGGLSNRYFADIAVFDLKQVPDNQYNRGFVNPLAMPGFLMPANNKFTDLTNVAAITSGSQITRIVSSNDEALTSGGSNTGYFGKAAKIHAVNFDNDTIQNSGGVFPHTIAPGAGSHSAHTTFVVKETVMYQINGARRMMYFYVDNTDGDMGTFNLTTSFTADDANEAAWTTATRSGGGSVSALNKNFDIIAEVSDNNLCYVANGSNLHKLDGTTAGGSAGTVTESVLVLDANHQFVDMIDVSGRLFLGISNIKQYTGTSLIDRDVRILPWNRQSLSNPEDSIALPGVAELVSLFKFRGVAHCFTVSLENVVELRRYNGSEFELIRNVGQASDLLAVGAKPAHRRAVIPMSLGILWYTTYGNIFYYGQLDPTQPVGLYKIGNLDTSGVTNPGAIVNSGNGEIYITTDTAVKTFTPFATGDNAFDIYNTTGADYITKVYEIPHGSTLSYLKIFYQVPYTSPSVDDNIIFRIFTNFGINASGDSNGMRVNGLTDGSKGYKYFALGGKNWQNVHAVQLGVGFGNAGTFKLDTIPRVYRIAIGYETPGRKK